MSEMIVSSGTGHSITVSDAAPDFRAHEGSMHIDKLAGHVYVMQPTGWLHITGATIGPKGLKGEKGDKGDEGPRGKAIKATKETKVSKASPAPSVKATRETKATRVIVGYRASRGHQVTQDTPSTVNRSPRKRDSKRTSM